MTKSGGTASRCTPASQLRRLLRLLARDGTGRERAAGANTIAITFKGKELVFDSNVVAVAEREGMIARGDGSLHLLPKGQAALIRMLHPEDGYHAQHGDAVTAADRKFSRIPKPAFNDCESPLARLYARTSKAGGKFLSAEQFAAGEKLRGDFEKAQLQPRISPSWDRPISASGRSAIQTDLSDFAIDARRRVSKAVAALAPDLCGVALDICCFLKGFEQVEGERKLPPRSAKLLLRAALSILADHYGLVRNRPSAGRILQWGADGYRPVVVQAE